MAAARATVATVAAVTARAIVEMALTAGGAVETAAGEVVCVGDHTRHCRHCHMNHCRHCYKKSRSMTVRAVGAVGTVVTVVTVGGAHPSTRIFVR